MRQMELKMFLIPKNLNLLPDEVKISRQKSAFKLLRFSQITFLSIIWITTWGVFRIDGGWIAKTALASSTPEDPKSSSQPTSSPASAVVEPKAAKTPIDRHIFSPKIVYQGIDGKSRLFDPGSFRFSVLVISASWNKESERLWTELRNKETELKNRGIGVLFLFSHDSPDGLKQFVKKNSGNFFIGLDKNDFIEKLINPKVPTIFIISHKNEFMLRKELPSQLELEGVISKLLLWTDF